MTSLSVKAPYWCTPCCSRKNDNECIFSTADVLSHWKRNHTLFWHPPFYFKQKLRLGTCRAILSSPFISKVMVPKVIRELGVIITQCLRYGTIYNWQTVLYYVSFNTNINKCPLWVHRVWSIFHTCHCNSLLMLHNEKPCYKWGPKYLWYNIL